jgi:hypothetical protein
VDFDTVVTKNLGTGGRGSNGNSTLRENTLELEQGFGIRARPGYGHDTAGMVSLHQSLKQQPITFAGAGQRWDVRYSLDKQNFQSES